MTPGSMSRIGRVETPCVKGGTHPKKAMSGHEAHGGGVKRKLAHTRLHKLPQQNSTRHAGAVNIIRHHAHGSWRHTTFKTLPDRRTVALAEKSGRKPFIPLIHGAPDEWPAQIFSRTE